MMWLNLVHKQCEKELEKVKSKLSSMESDFQKKACNCMVSFNGGEFTIQCQLTDCSVRDVAKEDAITKSRKSFRLETNNKVLVIRIYCTRVVA